MFDKNEVGLLRDTLKKCHIDSVISESAEVEKIIGAYTGEILTGELSHDKNDCGNQDTIEEKNIYRRTDLFGFSYTYFLLSDNSKNKVLIVGPYLHQRPSEDMILEYAEKNMLSPKQRRYLSDRYASTAVLTPDDSIFAMINSFCERSFSTRSLRIVDKSDETSSLLSPIGSIPKEENFDEIIADMKTMERRYEYENELIESVTLGHTHKESLFAVSFDDAILERRVADPIRNAKNYCIIMNTLLRKGAESGGVHPIYIDRISSDFAMKIERIISTSETPALMKEMFGTYCRLVRNHSMKGHSELIKNTILLIDSDVSAPLSAGNIAKNQNVSLGYLSALFKKECGKTLTGYIKEKRIAHAKHLLKTTELQIQNIAQRCGIMDLQYFSKLFKKNTGMTPVQYRQTHAKD